MNNVNNALSLTCTSCMVLRNSLCILEAINCSPNALYDDIQ